MLSQSVQGLFRRESQATHDADLHERDAPPDGRDRIVVNIIDRVAIARRVQMREVVTTGDQELSVGGGESQTRALGTAVGGG
jgi:hypothetical protein